jgi:hypothetical protein
MSKYLNAYQYSLFIGVSNPAVYGAIRDGRVIRTKLGIDPENPVNKYFAQCAKEMRNKQKGIVEDKDYKIEKKPATKRKPATKGEKKTPKSAQKQEDESPGADVVYYNPKQKAYEDTRLQKAKADKAVLEFAEKLGAVVDIETLEQRMGRFADFLVSQLLYMSEDVADIIYMRSKNAENPELVITEILQKRIAGIIEKAKIASARVVPRQNGAKYVILDLD